MIVNTVSSKKRELNREGKFMEHRKTLYRSYISSIYQNLNELSEVGYEKAAKGYKNYLKFLPKDKTSRILDCGAGPGYFVYFLKKQGYTNVVGIDSCNQAVEIAKGMDLNILRYDILDFLENNKSECFDLIVALDILEHLTKDEVLKVLSYLE